MRYGFTRLDVFGSVARGEERPDSDIDVLYELAANRHLTGEIEDAVDELASILGRPVDLVSRRSVTRCSPICPTDVGTGSIVNLSGPTGRDGVANAVQ